MLGQYHSNQEIYDNQVVVFDTGNKSPENEIDKVTVNVNQLLKYLNLNIETYSWHWIISNGVPPIGRRSHSASMFDCCSLFNSMRFSALSAEYIFIFIS